jgi:hypothetical protein
MTRTLIDGVVVGREGNRFLLADVGNEPMRPARVHDLDTGQVTDANPLQVWFKWANWEDATDADYQAALAEN